MYADSRGIATHKLAAKPTPRPFYSFRLLVVIVAITEAAGKGAFIGFVALTLGQTILHAARPQDMGYVAEAHSTMQVGAVGGAVLSIVFFAVTIGIFSFGAGQNSGGAMVPIFTVFGAASGPLGVAILKHYKRAGEQAEMLDVLHAARAGGFGWFLLGVLAAQQYREILMVQEKEGVYSYWSSQITYALQVIAG